MTLPPADSNTVILLPNDGMGQAEESLRHRLLGTYLTLLIENDFLPAAICFFTNGIKLIIDGSPFLEMLRNLEAKGVRLIVCSTCLNHFGLADRVKVGIIGGMNDILEAQWRASKVITL